MSRVEKYFEPTVARDFLGLMLGKQIGDGVYREVYESKLDKTKVIKFETGEQSFSNVIEYETWIRVENTKYAKWFAPVIEISSCGSVLVMEKTSPMSDREYPEKIPAYFTDTKYENFGWLNGHIVCHDYGSHLLMEKGMTSRMKKADWWR